jgi:hypothetical protein
MKQFQMSKPLPSPRKAGLRAGRQRPNECQSSEFKTFEIWALDLIWHLNFDI